MKPDANGNYTVIVHPVVLRQMREEAIRWAWKAEWRRQRLARRGIVEPAAVEPYLGTFQGITFIETERVK